MTERWFGGNIRDAIRSIKGNKEEAMTHNHEHKNCCKHPNVKYCQKCSVPYCDECGKQWYEECKQNHSYPWYAYPYSGTTWTDSSPSTTWTLSSSHVCTH